MSQPRITTLQVAKISKDLDIFIQQEQETNVFATKELKEYVQSKLEESLQDAKKRVDSQAINPPKNYNAFEILAFIWQKQQNAENKLLASYNKANTKILSLDEACFFELLRIIFSQGFKSACRYVLSQPITITPKPHPGTI